jgi:hypothetical protein
MAVPSTFTFAQGAPPPAPRAAPPRAAASAAPHAAAGAGAATR